MTRILPRLGVLFALLLFTGCETTDDVAAGIGAGIRELGDAVTDVFRGEDETDDPIYKCQAQGHESNTPQYDACVKTAVAEHCTKYGTPSSTEYARCLSYFKDLQMVRRQVRAIGIPR